MKTITFAAAVAVCCAVAPAQSPTPLGLSQKEGVLFLNGQPYRGVGANYFDLFLRTLHDPNNATSLTGLEKLAKAGIPFVRFALNYSENDWAVYFKNPQEYFRRLDRVVQTAEKAKIGLIPSFFWHFMIFPDLANEPRDQWGNPESQTHARMRRFTAEVVERYRGSPAVWAYEFGNEANLMADLPNAGNFRKKNGTERDDFKSEHLTIMLSEFAKEARRRDPNRLIISGNSHPRASAWHNTAEKSWKPDSREQTLEVLRRDNPPPLDTIGIHIYAEGAISKELAAWASDHAEYLRSVRELARQMKRPLFVGEFGLAKQPDPADERARFEKLLADLETAEVDLAAFWVFDLPSQEKNWNASFENPRAYMIQLTAEANRRWNAAVRKVP